MKNKRVLAAVGVALAAGMLLNGESCRRVYRDGIFTDSPCTDGALLITSAFVPRYDFAELRDTSNHSLVLQSAGKRCATATSVETCEAAVAAARSETGWHDGRGRWGGQRSHLYIVATRGDAVHVFDGSDIGAALAPIDSPLKAALVASIDRGIGLGCERAVRQVDTGYEVQLTSGDCRDLREEVIRVAVNGYLMVISTEAGPGQACLGSLPPPLPTRSPATEAAGRGALPLRSTAQAMEHRSHPRTRRAEGSCGARRSGR